MARGSKRTESFNVAEEAACRILAAAIGQTDPLVLHRKIADARVVGPDDFRARIKVEFLPLVPGGTRALVIVRMLNYTLPEPERNRWEPKEATCFYDDPATGEYMKAECNFGNYQVVDLVVDEDQKTKQVATIGSM